MVTETKAFKRWQKRVNDIQSPWTETEIIYFRKYLRSHNEPEIDELYKQFSDIAESIGYSITIEQSLKGIEYLRKACFRLDGGLRKSAPFTLYQARHLAKEAFIGFKFRGLCAHSWGLGNSLFPIYEVISTFGGFDYLGVTASMIETVPQVRKDYIQPIK